MHSENHAANRKLTDLPVGPGPFAERPGDGPPAICKCGATERHQRHADRCANGHLLAGNAGALTHGLYSERVRAASDDPEALRAMTEQRVQLLRELGSAGVVPTMLVNRITEFDCILNRTGEILNASRKRDDWGQVRQRPRPVTDRVVVSPDENLRIVDDALWNRVRARRAEVEGKAIRFASGRISGRPPKNAVRNLLAGLATCGLCGGGLVVETSGRKRGRVAEYVCHRHRKNGTCSNGLRIAVELMNEAILSAIEEHALTPEAVEQVVVHTERDEQAERQTALVKEQRDLEKRIARLVAVVETGGDVPSILAKLRELEQREAAVVAELSALRPLPRLAPSVVEDRLSEWRRLLRQSTTQGRIVLQRVLQGWITFTPGGNGYYFEACQATGKIAPLTTLKLTPLIMVV